MAKETLNQQKHCYFSFHFARSNAEKWRRGLVFFPLLRRFLLIAALPIFSLAFASCALSHGINGAAPSTVVTDNPAQQWLVTFREPVGTSGEEMLALLGLPLQYIRTLLDGKTVLARERSPPSPESLVRARALPQVLAIDANTTITTQQSKGN